MKKLIFLLLIFVPTICFAQAKGEWNRRQDFKNGIYVYIPNGADSGVAIIDTALIFFKVYHGESVKSIRIDTAAMIIRDDAKGKGFIYAADYSEVATSLSVTPKIYQDEHIGGRDVNVNVINPGAAQDEGVVSWNNTEEEYGIATSVPIEEAAGVMIVVLDTILYSNTTVDTIATLPVGAVIWDIQVYVKTSFTGTGTDLLDVGIIGDTDRYENDLDLAVSVPKFIGLSNVADRILGTSDVIFQYFDSEADANAGEAYIYVHYSIH